MITSATEKKMWKNIEKIENTIHTTTTAPNTNQNKPLKMAIKAFFIFMKHRSPYAEHT